MHVSQHWQQPGGIVAAVTLGVAFYLAAGLAAQAAGVGAG